MIIDNVGYYRLLSGDSNNRKDDRHPLIVNYCGYYHTDSAFHSFNKGGRNDYYLMFCTKGSFRCFCRRGRRSWRRACLSFTGPAPFIGTI